MDWTTIVTIIGSFGGLEFIKWLTNRKAYTRKENAKATNAEVSVYHAQIEAYERRLITRDTKVDLLYKELREEQQKNLSLIEKVNELELDRKLLMFQKCEVRGCPQRKPPGEY